MSGQFSARRLQGRGRKHQLELLGQTVERLSAELNEFKAQQGLGLIAVAGVDREESVDGAVDYAVDQALHDPALDGIRSRDYLRPPGRPWQAGA